MDHFAAENKHKLNIMDKFITRKADLSTTSKDIPKESLSFFTTKRGHDMIEDDPCVINQEEEPTSKSSKKNRIYMHKYRSEWETNPKFKNLIQPSTLGNTYFRCKICAKDYIGGTAALRKHMSSKKHQDKVTAVILQHPVTQTFKLS